jgi:outer membrane biosynthesis protein TonB
MVLVVLLALALIAAPAIAQNEESTTPDTPNGGPPSDGAGASLPEPPAPEPPAQKNTPPETSVPEPPVSDPPAPEPPAPEPPAPEPPAQKHEGPVSDTNADDPSPTPGDFTSTGSGSDVADGPDGRTRDNTDKDEIPDDDEVDAEAREDRLADRILAQLRDGKKVDENEDEDDANKDDVEQSQDQDADSGDADQDADVINTGDNVNQCVGILQVANTGNAQNATGVIQYDSEADEVELEDGSRITLTPQLVVDCRQIILQIVRGERPNESKISKAGLREVIRPARGAALANRTGAGVIVPSSRSGVTVTPKVLSVSSAGRPAGQQLRTSARSLPRTGGSDATLLGLGTGVVLVGGGLLVRRLAR